MLLKMTMSIMDLRASHTQTVLPIYHLKHHRLTAKKSVPQFRFFLSPMRTPKLSRISQHSQPWPGILSLILAKGWSNDSDLQTIEDIFQNTLSRKFSQITTGSNFENVAFHSYRSSPSLIRKTQVSKMPNYSLPKKYDLPSFAASIMCVESLP